MDQAFVGRGPGAPGKLKCVDTGDRDSGRDTDCLSTAGLWGVLTVAKERKGF